MADLKLQIECMQRPRAEAWTTSVLESPQDGIQPVHHDLVFPSSCLWITARPPMTAQLETSQRCRCWCQQIIRLPVPFSSTNIRPQQLHVSLTMTRYLLHLPHQLGRWYLPPVPCMWGRAVVLEPFRVRSQGLTGSPSAPPNLRF